MTQPSPRVDLGQWLPFPSDRLITTVRRRENPLAMADTDNWFEATWADRQDEIYPRLFGPVGSSIFPVSAQVFTETFQQGFDPRWLHCGVFESSPNQQHESWLYVTSGLSNEWDDEHPDSNSMSGLGCEFVFETTTQGQWAILRVQHIMAFQILLAHDRYPGRDLLDIYDRIPLRGPITPAPSSLTLL